MISNVSFSKLPEWTGELSNGLKRKKNEELVQHMKLEMLKERLSIGAEQAKQGKFVAQSVSDIITEARNA